MKRLAAVAFAVVGAAGAALVACDGASSDGVPAPDAPSGSGTGTTHGDAGSTGTIVGGGAAGDDASAPAPLPPLSTTPQLLVPGEAFYPRAVRRNDAKGTIVASVVTPVFGHLQGTILESTDDALSFHAIGAVDSPSFSTGLCCSTLYELPRSLGALPAGALLWAASVGGDTQSAPMSIPVFASTDGGRSWSPSSVARVAGVARSQGGLWEPELVMTDDGALVVHLSDETDGVHSQKLVELRTTDGVHWGEQRDTVAFGSAAMRPGMANVRRPPGRDWVMTYEVCGFAYDNCTAYLRTSPDGWSWGDPNALGERPATVDGRFFRHAPTLAWSSAPGENGRFFLMGQMTYAGSSQVAPENGDMLLANTEKGFGFWYALPAPVPVVPAPYDNFCPNYSSSVLPLDDGKAALEIASRWDGDKCRSYFARGPLLGTADAAGITEATTYRLVSVQSGMCLDVSMGSTAPGANVQQWTCNALPPQDWTPKRTAPGASTFTLTAGVSGMCLTATGDAPNDDVVQAPCDGGAHQAWTLRNVGTGAYVLAHAGTTSCLDVSGGSKAAGGDVRQWTCNDLSPQIWRFLPH